MTIRKIAEIGHPILRQPALLVGSAQVRTPVIQTLIDDMIETMRDANGAGIAAPQVFASLRIFVVEVNNNPRYPYKPSIPLSVFIDPEITTLGDETFDNYEGCLSVPNLRGIVKRCAKIRLKALDREGHVIEHIFPTPRAQWLEFLEASGEMS